MTTNYTKTLRNLIGDIWCLIGPSVSARGQLPSLIELNLTFALELDRQLCWIETSMTLRKINIEKSVSNSPVIRTTGATESNLWERFADKTIYCEINCFAMSIENSYCKYSLNISSLMCFSSFPSSRSVLLFWQDALHPLHVPPEWT